MLYKITKNSVFKWILIIMQKTHNPFTTQIIHESWYEALLQNVLQIFMKRLIYSIGKLWNRSFVIYCFCVEKGRTQLEDVTLYYSEI